MKISVIEFCYVNARFESPFCSFQIVLSNEKFWTVFAMCVQSLRQFISHFLRFVFIRTRTGNQF